MTTFAALLAMYAAICAPYMAITIHLRNVRKRSAS